MSDLTLDNFEEHEGFTGPLRVLMCELPDGRLLAMARISPELPPQDFEGLPFEPGKIAVFYGNACTGLAREPASIHDSETEALAAINAMVERTIALPPEMIQEIDALQTLARAVGKRYGYDIDVVLGFDTIGPTVGRAQ